MEGEEGVRSDGWADHAIFPAGSRDIEHIGYASGDAELALHHGSSRGTQLSADQVLSR